MVYLPTFTIQLSHNVGRYTIHGSSGLENSNGWKIFMIFVRPFCLGNFCLFIYIYMFLLQFFLYFHTYTLHNDPKYKIGHNLLLDFRYDPYDNAVRNDVFDCVTTPGKISMEFENRLF